MKKKLIEVALPLEAINKASAREKSIRHGHLRCGDVLFGGRVHQMKDELGKLAGGQLQQDDLRRVEAARLSMQAIGELTDIDIAESDQSKALMDQIEVGLRVLQRTLDFLQAKRWAGKGETKEYAETWVDLLNHEYGDNLLTYS
jgi:hypothetical protein